MPIKVLFLGNYAIPMHNIRPEAEMIIGLKQRGLDIEVMTQADCDYARRMAGYGIRIHDYTPPAKFSLQAFRVVRRTLEAGRHDIVHLFNNKAIVAGVHAALGLPVKVVTYRGQTGNISRFDPVAYLTHLSPRVDRIVCVAEAVRQSLLPEVRDPRKVVTIYKGHDLAWYQAPPANLDELGISRDSMVVGLVANARPRKGIPLFLRALRHLPDDVCCDVLLVGAGTEVFREATVGLPGRTRVHFLGYRPDAAEVIAACNVSVLPALRREGLPKATIEAMAYGVTPLVTRTGGNAELVLDGDSGLVVEPGSETELAEALTWLYRNPDRRREIGRAARERIGQYFNIRDTVARTFDLYQSLLR